MRKVLSISSLLVLVLFIFLQGCSSMKGIKGTEELVETSGKKPKMVANNIWSEDEKDAKYFLGFSAEAHDQDVALRVAELEGRKHIIEAIGMDIRVEGTRGLSGPEKESVGRFFEEATSWLTDNMRLSGAILQETYWEKWARMGDSRVSYFYKAYGIVRISKEDYTRAMSAAADSLIGQAAQDRNIAAERAARGAKQRLLEGAAR